MKPLRLSLLFGAFCGLLAVLGLARAAEFSPVLDEQLAHARDGEFVSAIVILESPIDIRALDDKLHIEQAEKVKRHADVLAALHYNADATQPKFVSEFDQAIKDGVMKGYTAYWVENLFVISATKDFIEGLRHRGDVKYATENFKPELITPVRIGDEGRPDHNSLDNLTCPPGIRAIGALRVNQELGITGQGVLIGSCDTGVLYTHPALQARWQGNFAPWWQGWRDDINHNTTVPSDGYGHGTHTVGTMAGRAISGADTIWTGCAPDAHWMATNAINQSTGTDFNNDVIADFQWFTDPDTVTHSAAAVPDVVHNSWGVNSSFSGYTTCFEYWNTVVLNCEAGGTVITWSAGNEGSSGLRAPAIFSFNETQIFSVGAVDASAYPTTPYPIASFSSRGPTTCTPYAPNNIKPEISAPGVSVYSTYNNGGYTNMDGTSMAGPHVAGVVALMRQACPNCDPTTIKMAIINTAVRTGYVTPPATENNTFGNGFIDAYSAVLSVMGNLSRVMGTIRDANTTLPLVANVQVVGGTQNTVSSAAGSYSLMLPGDSTYTLRYSLYGYATQDFQVHVVAGDTTFQDVNLVPRPVVTLLSEDFEGGAAGWTHSTPGGTWVDQWNITTQRAHGGTHAYKCGDVSTGTYANYNDARLTSPTLTSLPADARLKFWHQIEAEVSAAYGDSAYDGGVVEISANGGAFTQLPVIGNYPKTFRWRRGSSNPATGPMLGNPCFSGSVTTWTQVQADLAAYAGQAIQLRFRFGSDQSTGLAGWFVDDVLVTAFGATDLTAPESVVIYSEGDDLLLNWADDGSPSYRIYSDTDPMGSYGTFVGTTTATSYTIVGGAATDLKMFYIVRGWDGN